MRWQHKRARPHALFPGAPISRLASFYFSLVSLHKCNASRRATFGGALGISADAALKTAALRLNLSTLLAERGSYTHSTRKTANREIGAPQENGVRHPRAHH
jgi:hypothetical protein